MSMNSCPLFHTRWNDSSWKGKSSSKQDWGNLHQFLLYLELTKFPWDEWLPFSLRKTQLLLILEDFRAVSYLDLTSALLCWITLKSAPSLWISHRKMCLQICKLMKSNLTNHTRSFLFFWHMRAMCSVIRTVTWREVMKIQSRSRDRRTQKRPDLINSLKEDLDESRSCASFQFYSWERMLLAWTIMTKANSRFRLQLFRLFPCTDQRFDGHALLTVRRHHDA